MTSSVITATTTLIASEFDSFVNAPTVVVPEDPQEEQEQPNRYLGAFYKFKQEKLANIRPVSDFFDRNRFRPTTSFPVVTQRWNYNLQYFSSNYVLVMICLAMYAVLTNWFLLFTIVFIYGGIHMISKLSESGSIASIPISMPKLYTGYAIGSLLLLFISGATSTIFWIIGAGVLIILCHATMLEPGLEGDFADNQV